MLNRYIILTSHVGEQEVKSLKVMCSNSENGCGWVGELRSLDDHLTTCEYALLHCPNKCMEKKRKKCVLRCDLDQHLTHECPNRQYQCPHCKHTGRYRNITTTHFEICSKVKTPCPNSECKVSVLRCNLANHQLKCQYEEVPCKYAKIGCEEEPLRKDLQQHGNDAILHLPLAIETVSKQQEEINELREEVKAVKEEQKIKVIGAAGRSDSYVFKFPEYYRRNLYSEEWYSPPFYTHPGGYKMCIEVDADGYDDGAGTHVSVLAYLMKGKNDDNLPWPFTGEVTITLLNQLEDENHYTDTISFPQYSDETNERVVDDERAPDGYGESQFISHDELDFDFDDNCQYLKDDCLFFEIKVEVAEPDKPWLTCTA